MKYIQKVSKGKVIKPNIDIIYGGPGVGKSSWAAGAPDPYFIDIEEGTKKLNVTRMDPSPKNFMEFMGAMHELLNEKHDYKTLVVDSLDHLEMMIWDYTIMAAGIKNRSDFNSYGRGPELALEHWQQFASVIKPLKEKMNVILICHSQVKEVKDPLRATAYDRHDLKIHKKAAALMVETSDSVLFARKEPGEAIEGIAQVGKERRALFTSSTIAHEGKNRDNLPYKLPLDYQDYAKAKLVNTPEPIESMQSKIIQRLDLVKDADTRTKAKEHFEKNKGNPEEVSKILNRLETLTA